MEVAYIPGDVSTWRDIKSWNNYIYVGTENINGGIQIISMVNPNNPELVNTIEEIGSSHNIMISDGYLYVVGTENQDLYILDLQNPVYPEIVGTWSGDYFHDVCIKNDFLFGCSISTNTMHIININDKSNPYSVGSWENVPSAHACWVDPNNDNLMTASETIGGHVMSWDISNINNIELISEWAPDSSELKSAHNIFIRDNYAYVSYYVFGLQILNIENPEQPLLAGYYDTYPGMEGLFSGAWGVYPYQPSCNIYITDRQNGLFVVKFQECLGVDPDDPISPQNLSVYSDFETPNSVILNWENPGLLYNNNPLHDYDILIFSDSILTQVLQNYENSYTHTGLIDGDKKKYELYIKSNINDSLSLGVEKIVWVGGHPIPKKPVLLSFDRFQNSIHFEIKMPNSQLDGTPLDDLENLMILRNGSIINTYNVFSNETMYLEDIPFPGFYHDYQFFVTDNETPTNTSQITYPLQIFFGEYPDNIIIPICHSTMEDATLLKQDLTDSNINSSIININQLSQIDSYVENKNFFLLSGIYPNDCIIDETIIPKLENLLSSGNNLYLEGGDVWTNMVQSNLISLFGVTVLSDGTDTLSQIIGLSGTLTSDLVLDYNGANNWIDQLHSISPAYTLLTNINSEYSLLVVNQNDLSNTIASSFELSGITNQNQRQNLIYCILQLFDNQINPNWIKGDLNFDNNVNIIDILLIVEFIIENSQPNQIQYWISDINHDDLINIQDITLIMNYILIN